MAFVAVGVLATGCRDFSMEGSYKPPFVPISVSINEKGELSASFDGSIVTPIGTFSLNVTPNYSLDADDGLLEILHKRFGEAVRSLFVVDQFAKGEAEMTVDGGDVEKSGDQQKTTIEVSPDAGAQEFTLEVDDTEAVETPETTSVTTWTEPEPTTTSPESSSTESSTSEPPSSTESSPESVPATLPSIEIAPTSN